MFYETCVCVPDLLLSHLLSTSLWTHNWVFAYPLETDTPTQHFFAKGVMRYTPHRSSFLLGRLSRLTVLQSPLGVAKLQWTSVFSLCPNTKLTVPYTAQACSFSSRQTYLFLFNILSGIGRELIQRIPCGLFYCDSTHFKSWVPSPLVDQ